MKELVIKLKLDRSMADAAAAAHVENLKRIKAAHEANAQTHRKASQDAVTSDKAVAAAAKAAGEAQKKAAQQITQGLNDSRAAGQGLASSLTSLIGVAGGLGIIVEAGRSMSATMNDARKEADRLTEQFIRQRDALREIAAISGGQANNRAVLENAAFNSATGMRADESKGFITEFLNAGNQNIGPGRSLSAAEAEKFKTLSGQFATAKGVDPTIMGNLAGSTLGFQNFSARGQGATQAQDSLNRSFAVLEAGKGTGSVLARQLQMLSSSAVNEDAMKGIFKSPEEAAIAISVGAESHDANSAEMVQATARGLYATSGKEKDFLDAAKVEQDDDFFTRVRKVADYTKANANDKGMRTSDFLGESFTDHLTKRGLEVFVNRGIHGGVIDQRRGVLAGVKPGQDNFAAALNDPDGAIKQRVVEARNAEAEARRVAGRTGLQQLGIEADTAITASGSRDSVGMGVLGGLYNTLGKPFQAVGILPDFKEAQRRRVMGGILDMRRAQAGLPALGGYDTSNPTTALGYGGTLTGAGEDQALIKSLDELNRRVEENTKAQRAMVPQVPAPLAAPRPVATR